MTSSDNSLRSMLHRSGAAARRANLSPATLRVWERRYAIVDPARSAAGQRLYCEEDIERLKRLKLLVDRGYAIGTVARLSMAQLLQLPLEFDTSPQDTVRAYRWSLIGAGFAQRVLRWGTALKNFDSYKDLAGALAQTKSDFTDIGIVHTPSLREDAAEQILALKERNPQSTFAVVYSFGITHAISALRRADLRLVREPVTRAQFEQLTQELCASQAARSEAQVGAAQRTERLFSEQELEQFERQATSIRCECPNHLVSLIQQAAAFESYSDDCLSQNPADESLHRYLGDMANQARALFEAALQRVAAQEGLRLEAVRAGNIGEDE